MIRARAEVRGEVRGQVRAQGGGTSGECTRVVVVDDHVMFAELLARRLDEYDDIEVVSIAGDVAAAVRVSLSTRVDVAVVDYHLPGSDGIAAVSELGRSTPRTRSILLGSHEDEQLLRAAVAAGCAGYVTKCDEVDALVRAIRSVRGGGLGFDARALEVLAAPRTRRDRAFGLTDREMSVIRLLAEGASTQELADRLFVSVTTARNHVQRVMGKLGAHSRLEAVAIAARAGLIPRGGDAEPPADSGMVVSRPA